MLTTAPEIQSSKDVSAISAIIDGLHKAHHDKDAAPIAEPFATDAAIFNLAPPLAHHGIDIQEKQAWLDSWSTPVEITSRDMKITVKGDLAFCHGFLQMRGTKKSAEGKVSFWTRETICLERTETGWQIVHEHTSVPFYMDGTLRPAFDLVP